MRKRWFEVQLTAPALLFGLVTGALSILATSAASLAAEQMSSKMEGASAVAELLPSSADPSDPACFSCAKPEDTQLGVPVAAVTAAKVPVASEGAQSAPPRPEVEERKVSVQVPSEEKPPDEVEEAKPDAGAEDELIHAAPAPRDAPLCPGIAAYIITVFEDPVYSVATLTTDPKRQATRRKVGQKFGEYEVLEIAFNRRHMTSAVWLGHEDYVCQVQLRQEHPRRERVQSAAVRKYRRKQNIRRKRAKARQRRSRKK